MGGAKRKTTIRVKLASNPPAAELHTLLSVQISGHNFAAEHTNLAPFLILSTQLITRFVKLRDSSGPSDGHRRLMEHANLPANAQHRADCMAHYLVRRCRSEMSSRPGQRGYRPDSQDDQVDAEFFGLFQNSVRRVPGFHKCLRFAPQIRFRRHQRLQASYQGRLFKIVNRGRGNIH